MRLFNCRSSLWFLKPQSVPGSDPSYRRHFREIFGELKRKSGCSAENPGSPSKRIHLMRQKHARALKNRERDIKRA
jgi:hypothetical protein